MAAIAIAILARKAASAVADAANAVKQFIKPASTGAREIRTAGARDGWRYFDDGTAIGPDGIYYKNGVQVYDPQAEYRSSF